MKKLTVAIVLVLLAGVSFGVSYLVSFRTLAAMPAPSATTEPSAASRAVPPPAPDAMAPDSPKEQQLDDLVKELRRKIAECGKRQDELDQREKHLQIANEAFKKRAEELDAVRLQLVTPLATLKDAQTELQRKRAVVGLQEKANLKRTAAIYDKMDPTKAARIILDMCGADQEQDAAKILHFMTERGAAKLLAEVADKGLAARLCDQLKRLQEES
jgi:flagellar motility protein MotE (MotC chaperone)